MAEPSEVKGLELSGPVEVTPIDISEFIGKKGKIESVQTFRNEFKGRESFYLKVSTGVLGSVGDVELKASRLFSLRRDAEKNTIGWPAGGELETFMQRMKVTHPDDLIGKEVMVVPTVEDNNGRRWLTF